MSKNNLGDFLNQKQAHRLVAQFEEMVRNDQNRFFEQDSLETIIEYYEDRFEYNKAMWASEYALSQHPFSATFLIKKAQFVFESRKCEDALQLLDRAKILSPTDVEIAVLKSEIYNYLEDHKEALQILNEALILADSDDKATIYIAMSDIYDSIGDANTTYNCIKLALQIQPYNDEVLSKMDYAVEVANKYEESIAIHKEIIDEKPYCYLAWYNLANAYYGLGLYEKAIDGYGFVTAINEKYDFAYRDCGDAYFELEEFEKAKEQYLEVVTYGEPDSELYYNIGMCCYEQKQFRKAITYFEQTIAMHHAHSDAHFQIAECYEELGDLNKAIHFYNKSINLDKDNVSYLNALARLYYEVKSYEMAIMYYYKAIKTDPNQRDSWVGVVEVYFILEQYKEALDVMQIAINELGETPDNLVVLAACLLATGQKEEAFLKLAVALNKDFSLYEAFLELMPNLADNAEFVLFLEQHRNNNG